MIKRTPLLTIWAISFAIVVMTANSMNCAFWLAFVAFALTSVHIERNKKRLEKE